MIDSFHTEMNLSELNRWIGYLTIAASLCVLLRLVALRVVGRYWCIFGYLLADTLQGVLAARMPTRSLWYGYVYFGGQAAKLILAVCLSVQLWVLAVEAYPALALFGRRIASYGLLAALLVAAAGLALQPPLGPGQAVFPHYFNAFEGALDSMVALFLAAAAIFLLWFPVEIPRNVAVLIGGIMFFLLTEWAGLLLVNLRPSGVHQVAAMMLCVYLGCLIFWSIALQRSGETLTTVTGHRWNPEEAERLLGQLNAINARLKQAAS